jgi:hypothetical protein
LSILDEANAVCHWVVEAVRGIVKPLAGLIVGVEPPDDCRPPEALTAVTPPADVVVAMTFPNGSTARIVFVRFVNRMPDSVEVALTVSPVDEAVANVD